MKRLLLMILAVCAAATAAAQTLSVEGPAKARLYSRADFTVITPSVPSNPYLQEEAALDMILTAPSGKQLVLPCFWVEGKRWQARFTPQEKGRYTYYFRYREAGAEETLSAARNLKSYGKKGHGILHTRDNWTLVLDDGTPYRGIGENICWESRDRDDSKFFSTLHERADRYNYDVLLPEFAAAGGNFTRMWMCSWNFPIDRHDHFNNSRYTPSDEYFNPSAVERLDHVVELAEKLDIKIMLCMGAGDVSTDREFFVSPEAKARYLNRLRYIVARWGYSPAIGMWEFFNEIDNIQFRNPHVPIPAEDIVVWHAEMSGRLDDLDPYDHIVTTSISHRDLQGLNDIPWIDINQKHIYCATSSIPQAIASYERVHGKPYVIGEFGYEWDWSKNFDDFGEDMDLDFRRGLWYGIFSPTPVTPMSWWWEYFDSRGLVPYLRGVRKVSDRMLSQGKGSFEQLPARAGAAEAFAVRCGKRLYVYAYNPSAETIDAITVDAAGVRSAKPFDFDALRFGSSVKVKASDGQFVIPVSLAPRSELLFEVK